MHMPILVLFHSSIDNNGWTSVYNGDYDEVSTSVVVFVRDVLSWVRRYKKNVLSSWCS